MLLQLVGRVFPPNLLARQMFLVRCEVRSPDVRFRLADVAVAVMLFL